MRGSSVSNLLEQVASDLERAKQDSGKRMEMLVEKQKDKISQVIFHRNHGP